MFNKVRSRSKSPKKKKIIKNVFDIVQFKKMIGKNMVKTCNVACTGKKTKDIITLDEIKKSKEKILTGAVKTISLSGYINNGVIYIFKGLDHLIIMSHITYQDLKKHNISIDVVVFQYEKLSKDDIMALIA